jgi:hypothetical protein
MATADSRSSNLTTPADAILADGLALAGALATSEHPDEPPVADEPTADDLAELTEWAAEQDARDFLDRSATLGLAELVEHQAAFYRAWPTEAGAMIAEALDDLAAKLQATDARTPDEYRARIGILEDEAREQHESVGYQAGLDAGREECRRKHGRTPSASFGGHPVWED